MLFSNYLKTSIRNLWKYKGYSFLNIAGLAMGVMTFIMIMLFIRDELSYDNHFDNADQIYRVATKGAIGGGEFDMAVSPAPVGAAFVEEIPGVLNSTRIRNYGFPVMRSNGKVFSEELWFTVDSTFFDVLETEFIYGDPRTALTQPRTVVLTKSTAERYFGNENPMGKVMTDNFPGDPRDYTITGVVADPPHSTHFKYEFLASLISYPNSANNQIWVNNNFYTYLTLDENTSVEQVENEFPGMVLKYAGPQIQQFMGVSFEKLMEQGASYGFHLQSLKDIHLNSQLELELEHGGNMAYLKIFAVIAIFILLIACINFMNLATARSARRAREVGVRKTLGSTRSMLIGQFLTEAVVMSFISFLVALLLVQLFLPFYNNLLGVQLQMNLFTNPNMLLAIGALVILVGISAGSYPAFFLASFDPIKVLKASSQSSGSRSWLRGGLVVFQFAISITLFTGTIVVNNQLSYIQNKDLGYEKKGVVIVEKTDDIGQDIEAFKQELKNDPRILSVSNSNNLFGHNFGQNVVQIQGEPAEKTILLSNVQTDHYFAETYGLELVKGRFYSWDRPGDSTKIVINEAAAKYLGYENPIGHAFDFGNPDNPVYFEIIGVVKDFHFESLHKTIRPFMFSLFGPGGFGRYTAVRITDEDIPATLTFIENVWKKYARDQAFEYVFFEDDFNLQYKLENNTKKISTIFSILAIMIASLGLFGLASFSAEQRTKEIGIRKILGASVKNIYVLLSKDLLLLVLIATIISWPLSTLVLTRWLEDYAYRINYSHLNFLLAGFSAFLVALMTITNQALKSANADPVKALKYE